MVVSFAGVYSEVYVDEIQFSSFTIAKFPSIANYLRTKTEFNRIARFQILLEPLMSRSFPSKGWPTTTIPTSVGRDLMHVMFRQFRCQYR